MKIQIDTLAYTNRLRWLPTGHKLLFAFFLLLVATISQPIVQILMAAWLSIWIVIYAGIPAQTYLKLICVATLFWLMSLPALIINGVNITQTHIVLNDSVAGFTIHSYYVYISHHGIEQGLQILTRTVASVSCLYFMMFTIPFPELLDILRRCGLPVLVTELLLLMYRFIFVLLNAAAEIWTAQQTRGGYRTFTIGLKSLALLIGQLLRRALDNYRQVSLCLKARGFQEEFKVWHPHRYQPSKRYILEALLGCGILMGLQWYIS